MSLKHTSIKFGSYPNRTEKPQLESLPSNLPAINTRLPVIGAIESQQYRHWNSLPYYTCGQQGWILNSREEQHQPITKESTLFGEHFIEDDNGVMAVTESKETGELMLSGKLSIKKIAELWEDEIHETEEIVCQMTFPATWQISPKEVRTPKEFFKDLPSVIRKKIPEAIVSTSNRVAWDEYLSAIYRRDGKTAEREIVARKTGWLTVHGKTNYWVGNDRFYAEYRLPNLHDCNRWQIFTNGWGFLNVGHNNEAIYALWLWAHMAIALYWFQRIDIGFHTILYMQGASGNLKTATVSVVSNIFDTNRNRATIRMTSTFPSIQESIVMSQDAMICLDDFANSETNERDRATENAEKVVRAVGDGIFPDKMSGYHFNEVRRDHVRCALVLTGEESLSLGRSSNLRSLVVPVLDGTFDGKELERFQQDPLLLRCYFMLFVNYLEENGSSVFSHALADKFSGYREIYARQLQAFRFIDTAAQLSVLIDVMYGFAHWCGTLCETVEQSLIGMKRAIEALLRSNQQSSQTLKPEVRFVYALVQSIGTGRNNGLASDEDAYARNEAGYIGFKDNPANQIWVRFEDAWKLVAAYYQKQGETWLTKASTIKVALLEAGISDGKRMPRGSAGNEYLRKAKKGSRKRMLVLNMQKVNHLMDTIEKKGDF